MFHHSSGVYIKQQDHMELAAKVAQKIELSDLGLDNYREDLVGATAVHDVPYFEFDVLLGVAIDSSMRVKQLIKVLEYKYENDLQKALVFDHWLRLTSRFDEKSINELRREKQDFINNLTAPDFSVLTRLVEISDDVSFYLCMGTDGNEMYKILGKNVTVTVADQVCNVGGLKTVSTIESSVPAYKEVEVTTQTKSVPAKVVFE